MRRLIEQFLSDETGATSIEYSMIAVGVAVAVITTVGCLGGTVKSSYVAVRHALN